EETDPIVVDLRSSAYSTIEEVIGNGVNSTLIAPDAPSTWNITGVNAGTVNDVAFAGFNSLVGSSHGDAFNFTTSTDPVHVVQFTSAPGVDGPGGTSEGEDEAEEERITIGDPPITGDVLARVRAHHPGINVSVTALGGVPFVVDDDGNSSLSGPGDFGVLEL